MLLKYQTSHLNITPLKGFGLGENTMELMETSIDYQDRATALQNDINYNLALIRLTVSEILKINMNETVYQTRENSDRILKFVENLNEKLEKLLQDDCYEDLMDLANGIIKITGFKIGNFLTEHDANVTIALGDAEEIVRNFNVMSTEVQRLVHRGFVKSNVFKDPEHVSQKYISSYKKFKAEWEEIRPQLSNIVLRLRNGFSRMLIDLGVNFEAMQKIFDLSFRLFESEAVTVCEEYSKTIKSKIFSGNLTKRKYRFFDPAVFLPDYDLY